MKKKLLTFLALFLCTLILPAFALFVEKPSGEGAETSAEAEEKPAEKPDFDSLMAELDSLIGLESVKREVRSLVNLIKVRKLREAAGLPSGRSSQPKSGSSIRQITARLFFMKI